MSCALRAVLVVGILVIAYPLRADTAVPAWLIRLPESVPTVFVAVTAEAEFRRYDRDGDDIDLSAVYYVSIGQNGTGKQRSGDRRTPIGSYFVTEQIDTSRLHEKYGITAFPLDYPNEWDRRLERSGDGIWVHGVDPRGGRRPKRDTDGCLALPNEDIAALASLFDYGRTPVLIGETLPMWTTAERHALAEEIEHAVLAWADSLTKRDLHTHLSLYSAEFERWSMNRTEWAAFVVATRGKRAISRVEVSDLLLLGYPGEDDLYLSRFWQRTTENGVTTETRKRLYWRRDGDGALKIVAEDNG